MNKDSAVERLKQLWQETHALADADTIMHERFQAWREQVLAVLGEIYGSDSTERRQFEAIRFEIDPKLLDVVERLLRGPLASDGFDLNKIKIDLDPKRHYAKRLSDAAELLLSFVAGLRQHG